MGSPEFLPIDESRPMTVGGIGSFQADDGYTIRYRRYRAAAEPRAIVVCVHGIQSHAGWYDASCRHLSHQGFEVFFVDRRGSGMNGEERGHCTGINQLTTDIVRAIAHARSEVPGRPVFLVGISWGGKLVTATIKAQPNLVDGLVLVCPGFFAKIGPTFRERMIIGGSFLVWPRRPVRVPLTEPYLFTDSFEWQEFLAHDRRLLRTGTVRLLMTSVFLDGVMRNAPKQIKIPVVTFLAGKDRIIDNDRVRAYVSRFASSDKQVIEYPSFHHTIEFESDPRPFFRDLTDWLSVRTERSATPTRLSG